GRTASFAVQALPAVSTGAAEVRETRVPPAAAAFHAAAARAEAATRAASFLMLSPTRTSGRRLQRFLPSMVREPTRSAMWALAHPVRFRIWELLREGPATATQLGRRLGESRGSMSYHLRMIAGTGIIV